MKWPTRLFRTVTPLTLNFQYIPLCSLQAAVTISGGGGSGATAVATLGSDATDDAGKIRNIRVTSGGQNYTSSPTVSITGGGGSGGVAVADLGGYKRQNDYYGGNLPYWSVNHRLLDTAYILANIEIAQDATTVPEFEYVVRGKLVQCHNLSLIHI